MGHQKRFHSIVQYTRRAAPAVLYCLGRAHEMMSRLAQTLSNKVISNYLHSAFVCRFFSCSQALQPTNNHGRSTQQQQQLRDHYNYTLVRFDKIFCLFFLEDKQFVKKPKRIRILQAFHNLFCLMYKTQKKVFENNSCRGEKKISSNHISVEHRRVLGTNGGHSWLLQGQQLLLSRYNDSLRPPHSLMGRLKHETVVANDFHHPFWATANR